MPSARVLTVLLLAATGAASLSAHAENSPKQIQMLTQSGAKVLKTFKAASNLKGWVISQDGHYSLLFTTPDNKTLLAGELIDESGNNLSARYAKEYFPQPNLAALFSEFEHSAYVAEGAQKSPKSVVYAIFDPNCPFCHLAWKALQPYEKAGLQVRWIPVAYLTESSAGKAAAILEAKDRVAAFRENEQKYNPQNHEGGVQALAKPGASTLQQLQANAELMQKIGASGTPALVWKDSQGKVHVNAGMPRLSALPAITGLPEQTETDASLARFR